MVPEICCTTDRRTDGRTDKWMGGWMDRWTGRWMDGWTNGRTEKSDTEVGAPPKNKEKHL